jgi:hypothetical protein
MQPTQAEIETLLIWNGENSLSAIFDKRNK